MGGTLYRLTIKGFCSVFIDLTADVVAILFVYFLPGRKMWVSDLCEKNKMLSGDVKEQDVG